MIRGFLYKKIKNFLSNRKIKREYYLRPEPDDYKSLDIAIKRENAELMGKLARVEYENENLRKIIQSLKNEFEKEIEEEVRLQEKEIKKLKKSSSYRILFKYPVKTPPQLLSFFKHKRFKDGNGNTYKFIRGIQLSNNTYGRSPLIDILISRTPKDKKIGVIETGVELSDIDKLFDLNTIINDLRAGRVIINLTPDGEFVPPKL